MRATAAASERDHSVALVVRNSEQQHRAEHDRERVVAHQAGLHLAQPAAEPRNACPMPLTAPSITSRSTPVAEERRDRGDGSAHEPGDARCRSSSRCRTPCRARRAAPRPGRRRRRRARSCRSRARRRCRRSRSTSAIVESRNAGAERRRRDLGRGPQDRREPLVEQVDVVVLERQVDRGADQRQPGEHEERDQHDQRRLVRRRARGRRRASVRPCARTCCHRSPS